MGMNGQHPDAAAFDVIGPQPLHMRREFTSSQRADRDAEDWWVGPNIDRGEVERNALACFRRTKVPQRIHGHLLGELCTSACGQVIGGDAGG